MVFELWSLTYQTERLPPEQLVAMLAMGQSVGILVGMGNSLLDLVGPSYGPQGHVAARSQVKTAEAVIAAQGIWLGTGVAIYRREGI